jgi:ATP-dependent Clp protease ATP-binding subunit ClpC
LHTIVGAGSAEGTMDASNIIKPALSRGEMQCIGATTLNEYRKVHRKGRRPRTPLPERQSRSAFDRRSDPHPQGVSGQNTRKHHKAEITDMAVEASVKLSDRYITDRYLPDKGHRPHGRSRFARAHRSDDAPAGT